MLVYCDKWSGWVCKAIHFVSFWVQFCFTVSFFFLSRPPAKPSTQHTPQQSGRVRSCPSRRRTTGSILMRRSKIIQSGDGGGDGGGGGGGRQVLGVSGRRHNHHRDDTNEIKNSSECSSSKRARISRDHTANDNGEFVERESPHGNSALFLATSESQHG